MKARVIIGSGVKAFMGGLAPQPRRKLRRAIKELADGKGDVKQLDGNLAPFWRLRVSHIRVIFDEKYQNGQRTILCFFADYRTTVYSVLEQLLASEFLEQLRN
jgi:mRNA-degrading endonuclease RelE of RelBE toxin-antitoxin system